MFQSPLSLVEFLQSSSGSGFGVFQQGRFLGGDLTDLNETTSLPRISQTPFDIRCHIGIIVIDESICANTALTLRQKLVSGRIYEHSGPVMTPARDAVGRVADEAIVARLVALEFVGHTNRENSELDVLLQELIRVDRGLNSKPPYRPIFWNCHDIACRFAFLAITPDAGCSFAPQTIRNARTS
ncbi:hypothetical protein J3458_001362 [Metarhizium acridum]|uniref:uncharacterized protein n=1 Tax=Metarhizium acridum TaxID=92637 RepID=UPI001C6AA2B6|nr:hypothetical protein J3458_001362 [Metarhizium acridum]